jgi:ribosomal protein L6P/L9E
MSRIGKKPVPLPKGVKVKMEEGKLMVTGPRGTLTQLMPPRVKLATNHLLSLLAVSKATRGEISWIKKTDLNI